MMPGSDSVRCRGRRRWNRTSTSCEKSSRRWATRRTWRTFTARSISWIKSTWTICSLLRRKWLKKSVQILTHRFTREKRVLRELSTAFQTVSTPTDIRMVTVTVQPLIHRMTTSISIQLRWEQLHRALTQVSIIAIRLAGWNSRRANRTHVATRPKAKLLPTQRRNTQKGKGHNHPINLRV